MVYSSVALGGEAGAHGALTDCTSCPRAADGDGTRGFWPPLE